MHPCVYLLSYTSTDTTFLSKATVYFSHMHLSSKAKIALDECLPIGIEPQLSGQESDT